ncbi:MAG: ATP-binding protein [bacterium]
MAEERRVVTALFADVTGSTALGETLDPEDVRALLRRFYAIAKEVIDAHGGTMEKFIGDAAMAVFGLPQAHGDDAQRALAAALVLCDRVRNDQKLGSRLPIRIGVNTGEVVATRDPSAGEFLVTGDAVNVAARLQQAVEPWGVLCGERTAHASPGFEFAPSVQIGAKGKAAPIVAFPLLGRKTGPRVPQAPLVGREADLSQLELVARRSFDEKRPFLVSLIAPAGIGKTRLLEEFLERLPSLAPHATVAIAQCLPYGQRLTYWPLRGVLFRLVGISEDSDANSVREAVRSWVRDAGIESAERVADLIAATVGAGEAEVVDRDSLFTAWRVIIEAASRRRPLVVAFEDLHWSSDSLLDLVEFVMQPRGDSPVVIMALARPELLDRRPAWGGGRRNYVALSLEPLADDAMAGMVRHMLPRASQPIVSKIVDRADGNAFYAGEMIRSVIEQVSSPDDEATVTRVLAQLPDTVQATVLARLDLLQPSERRVLQVGAVFGRTFRSPGVSTLAPELASDLPHLLDRLVDREIIRPADTDRYVFRHILIREVAYHALPRAERAPLHAAAGRWLESRSSGREDSLAELIAYHYREASILGGSLDAFEANLAAVKAKAVHWLKRAADVAAAGGAPREAVRHLLAAIELAVPDDLPDLYEALGDVSVGNPGAEAYRKALTLCKESGRSVDQQLRILAGLLTVFMRWQASVGGRPSRGEIEELLADGRALAARAKNESSIARFLIACAFYPFWLGPETTPVELDEAEASVRQGLQIAERLDDARLLSAGLDGLGGIAQERGSWEEARETARTRLSFQDRLDLWERFDAHTMVAWASGELGDLAEADRITAIAVGLIQPGQAVSWGLHAGAWRVYALVLLGRWEEALVSAAHCHTLWIDASQGSTGYALHGFMAALDVARARQDTALVDRYREVVGEITRSFPTATPFARMRPYIDPDVEALEALVIRDFTAISVARSHFIERALALCADYARFPDANVSQALAEHAARHQMRLLEAQARRALGFAQRDASELNRAFDLFQHTGAVPFAARVQCERGILRGNETDLTEGMRTLEMLGDINYLTRMQQTRQAS